MVEFKKKNLLINGLNEFNGFKCFIIVIDDHYISKSIKGINDIYFLGCIKSQNIQDYCGYSYLNNELDDVQLYFLKQIIKN